MIPKNIFSTQTLCGQIPTLMVNKQERKYKWVDTLAITMVAVYLIQLYRDWINFPGVQEALDFIEQRVYQHEIEGFMFWHFNGFYPPDWEDTSFAIFLLVRNNRLDINKLGPIRDLLSSNTTEQGSGVWIKDCYSASNAQQNHWDPTSAINILRLHYLLDSDKKGKKATERFVTKHFSLEQFGRSTLYYTAPVAAFFAKMIVRDFPDDTQSIAAPALSFYQEVVSAIKNGILVATSFESALLGFPALEKDNGLLFHHGKRDGIWYGSPILHELAMGLEVL